MSLERSKEREEDIQLDYEAGKETIQYSSNNWMHTCYTCSLKGAVEIGDHYNVLWKRYKLICSLTGREPSRKLRMPRNAKDHKDCVNYKYKVKE